MRVIISIALLLGLMAPTLLWSGHEYRTSRRSIEKEYLSVLKGWTRNDEAYHWGSFEARLVWFATYLSPSFRKAKVMRYADLYQLGVADIERLKQEESSEAAQYDSFFISVYAGSRQYRDLGKDRSLWRLVLETADGQVVEPQEWEEIPSNQVTRTFYPYIDRWSRTYKVKFPKVITKGTEEAQLKMVGIPADSALVWNLKELRKSFL